MAFKLLGVLACSMLVCAAPHEGHGGAPGHTHGPPPPAIITQDVSVNATLVAAAINNQTLITKLNEALQANDGKAVADLLMDMATGVSGGTDENALAAQQVLQDMMMANGPKPMEPGSKNPGEADKKQGEKAFFEPRNFMARVLPIRVAMKRLELRVGDGTQEPELKTIYDQLKADMMAFKERMMAEIGKSTPGTIPPRTTEDLQSDLAFMAKVKAAADNLDTSNNFPYLKTAMTEVRNQMKARMTRFFNYYTENLSNAGIADLKTSADTISALRDSYAQDGPSTELMNKFQAAVGQINTVFQGLTDEQKNKLNREMRMSEVLYKMIEAFAPHADAFKQIMGSASS